MVCHQDAPVGDKQFLKFTSMLLEATYIYAQMARVCDLPLRAGLRGTKLVMIYCGVVCYTPRPDMARLMFVEPIKRLVGSRLACS